MGVTIPLPELDVTKPAQNAPPDALAEFQRAAQLQTAAAQQQALQAQTAGQQTQNQRQAMQLKDEQLRRQLAPQFVQKDASGKPTGFDNEGLYNAMLQQGADPASIQAMRMNQAEMQKSLLGLSDAQIDHQKKIGGEFANSLESVRSLWDSIDQKNGAPAQGTTAATPAPPQSSLGPAVPGTGGMPAGMLPNMPEAQNIGKSPAGSPESLGRPEPGTAPTPTEGALQSASAPNPASVPNEVQLAYQKELMRLSGMGIPIGQLKPALSGRADLDQAEAELGLHGELLKERDALAATQEKTGKATQEQAEAAKAEWIGSDGTFANIRTGQVIHAGGSPSLQAFQNYVGHGGNPLNFAADQAARSTAATAPIDVNKAVQTELAKQNALSPALSQIVNTTRAGRQYINREDIPKDAAGVTEQNALKAGIPVVDKDTASTLSDIDTAKANQDYMLNQIGGKLATDPTGRLYKAPENTIEKLSQSDPTLAAMGTYRNAAIQSMRAVAGSKGLRINQYEVQLAIDNDIPKMTDTLPVAQQKLQNLKAFLNNTEQAHLVRNRQQQPTEDFFQQFGGAARPQPTQ